MFDDSIYTYILEYGLLATFLLMFINGSVSTLPSEIIMSLSGVIAHFDTLNPFYLYITAGISGNLLGMLIIYFSGSYFGYRWIGDLRYYLLSKNGFLKFLGKQIPDLDKFDFVTTKIKDDGTYLISIITCVPVIRTTINSLICGMLGIPIAKFIFYVLIGLLCWVTLWFYLGFFLGSQIEDLQYITAILPLGMFLLLILVLKIFIHKYLKSSQK